MSMLSVLAKGVKIVDTVQVLCHVLWTEGAVFTRSGGVHSLRSLHVWAVENLSAAQHCLHNQTVFVKRSW
jgi:hypothetical protein